MEKMFARNNINVSGYTPTHRKEENRLLSCHFTRRCHFLFIYLVCVTLIRTKIFIISWIKNNDFVIQRRALTQNKTTFSFLDENSKLSLYFQQFAICKFTINLFLLIRKEILFLFAIHRPTSFEKSLTKQTFNKHTKLSQISPNAIRKLHYKLLPSTVILFFSCFVATGQCNSPPRFMLNISNDDGASIGGSGIVLRLKEGGQQAGQPTIGTNVFHLKGIDNDGDPLTFGVLSNPDGIITVQNDPSGTNEANVILARELDAEEKTQYEVVLSLTDGRLGTGNFITRSMLILVEDTNDNPPLFKTYSSTVSVKENSDPGTVVAILEATDADSGIFGQIKYRLATDEKDNEAFEIGNLESVTNGAVVRLKHSLDYETQSVYQLKVIAMDRGGFGGFNQDRVNTATAAVLVKVEDVEDKKPEFIRVPSVTRVLEGVPKHTQVGIYISLHSN